MALALKVETADMYYLNYGPIGLIPQIRDVKSILEDDDIPAWSLHRLIEMMPSFIDIGEHNYMFSIIQGKLFSYGSDVNEYAFLFGKGSVYDSAIYTIEWLIKEGYFNKEYLEE